MITNKNSPLIILFFSILYLSTSCICFNKWEKAEILSNDGKSESLLVCCNHKSYFAFLKAKSLDDGKAKRLLPKDVVRVKSDNCDIISLHFCENKYGLDSYSFAKVLSGSEVLLVETKYMIDDCGCQVRGKYVHDYFVVVDNNKFKLETNKAGEIFNIGETFDFLEDYVSKDLKKERLFIRELKPILKNINN